MRPLRLLELRTATEQGGGPEKAILNGASEADPERFAIKICYLRPAWEGSFWVSERAEELGLDYVEIRERFALDPRSWLGLRRMVRESAIDLIHAHDYKTMLLALLLSRFEGVLAMATAHGWSGSRWRQRLLYYPAAKRLLRSFSHVVAVSRELREDLLEHGVAPERVTLLHNAVDAGVYRSDAARRGLGRERLGIAPDAFIVGSVGRLSRQKRFDLLIEAFSRVAALRPQLRLVVVGEGAKRGALQDQVRHLGLEDRVLLTGHRDDVPEILPAFDLFAFSSDYEGSSNAVLEAMAAGIPVVATSVGAARDLLQDGVEGVLVPAGDSEALAAAVRGVVDEPAAAAERAAAALRRVESEHTFERRRIALERIYERVVERARRSEDT